MSRYGQSGKLQHNQFASELLNIITDKAREQGRSAGQPAQGTGTLVGRLLRGVAG